MSPDIDTAAALERVSDVARRLREARGVERELTDLLAMATRAAIGYGAPGRAVAKAAGVTPGRVSQIVARTSTATPSPSPVRGYTDNFPYAAPASLDELRGPTSGQVTVPAHIDPFPDPVFDVGVESSRRSLYGAVVRAGTVEDQRELLDPQLLRELWPSLRLPAPSRRLWESRIPELAGP